MAIFGRKPYGPGTPAAVQDGAGVLIQDSFTGRSSGSRRISAATRDYVIDDDTGRTLGMTNTQQLVYMAISTTKGSAAMRSLGHDLRKIDRITSNFLRRVDYTLRAAVQHIVDRELIAVTDVQVQIVRPGTAYGWLRWRDLDTGEDNETLFGDAPHSAAENLRLPVLSSLNYNLADTAGGDSITIVGYRMDSATSITVGGTSATITANTATSATFTMPAKSAGTYDVVLTSALGASNPISIEAWSPAEISALTGQWRASFPGGTTWTDTVASRTLYEATNYPSTGSTVNGYAPASFDGADDLLTSTDTAQDLYSNSGYSMAALVYIDSFAVADPGANVPYGMPQILGETSVVEGPCGGVAGSGSAGVFRFGHLDSGIADWKSASVEVSTGAWVLLLAKYDGSSIGVAKNGGAWDLAAAVSPSIGAYSVAVGKNYLSDYFDGKMLHLLTANDAFTNTEVTKLRKYLNCRYAMTHL